jgi:hypothetical protein
MDIPPLMKMVFLCDARQFEVNYHISNLVCNDLFVKHERILYAKPFGRLLVCFHQATESGI